MNVLLEGWSPIRLEQLADDLERSPRGVTEAVSLRATGEDHDVRALIDSIGAASSVHVLRTVAAERRAAIRDADRRLELVWTGPEHDATGARDTAIVVRELFQTVDRDLLVAGYSLYNARQIFKPLAERMRERPALRVRLVLNIDRDGDARDAPEFEKRFVRRFRTDHWPDAPMPELYYDPRSLLPDRNRRAVMHAKCVVADARRAFVTSANLTEAAHVRNIELGVVINDAAWSRAVCDQFDGLIGRRALCRLRIAQ